MRLRPAGDRALLLDCADPAEARAWHAALADTTDVTLGARTVLVRGEPAEVRRMVASAQPRDVSARAGSEVVIDVVYDGPDLEEVARLTGLTVEEVVDDFGPRNLNAVILPHWTVGAVATVPGGAYPSYAQGYYKRDNAFYIAWDKVARERETFLAWMKENVLEQGPEAFAAHRRRLNAKAA